MVPRAGLDMTTPSAEPSDAAWAPLWADSGTSNRARFRSTLRTARLPAVSRKNHVPEFIPFWIAMLAEFAASAKDFVERWE